MATIHPTYCRNCPSLCGLLLEVEDNRILSIRGDREHPLTKGYFCVKGGASQEMHNGEDRLQSSQARQPDGTLADIDVEQALDQIHTRLGAIIEKHGPRAVAMYYGTGANNNSVCHSAMKGWIDLIGSPYIFSSMTVDQSAKWVAAGRMGMFPTGMYNSLDADVLMIVGNNPAISHTSAALPFHAPMKWLQEAKSRGLRLIVIDPRQTETARRADLHLPIRPGEDATLFAGLIRIVLTNGWHDESFCNRFVRNLDALRAAVEDFSPDYVAARTGIGRDLLETAAATFAKAGRKSASSGTGPNMACDANVAEHLISAFNTICGGYRRSGDLVRNTGLLFGGMASREQVIPPYRSWEVEPKCRTANIGSMFGEFPAALLPNEITAEGEDRIRALIVVGGNPAKAIGNPQRALASLRSLDLLVNINPRMTETGALSHYSIATTLPYERFDYTGIYDPLLSMSFASVATPVLAAPPGVIDDWQFFWGLARRSGRPLALKRPLFGAAHAHIPGPTLELNPDTKPNTEDIVRWMCSQGSVRYEDMLASPSGLRPENAVATVEAATEDDGARLDLCPADVSAEIRTLRERDTTDGRYRYRLIVRRLLETMNSAYTNSSRTRRRFPVNPAFMHPQDMEMSGITEGMKVEISGVHGSLIAYARGDRTMLSGTVALTHVWGSPERSADPNGKSGAFTGHLVSIETDLQPISYMPQQSAIPVNIRPAA
jgi:anaerobic selenocysteine-containing dehydrogenase